MGIAVPLLNWAEKAACVKADPNLFDQDRPTVAEVSFVNSIYCLHCPVIKECLEWVLAQEVDPGGIWAGMGPSQRRKIKKLYRLIGLVPLMHPRIDLVPESHLPHRDLESEGIPIDSTLKVLGIVRFDPEKARLARLTQELLVLLSPIYGESAKFPA